MSDSVQLTILKLMTTIIEGVTTANGYAFDLSGRVYRGRKIFGSEVSPPFVSLLESPKPGDELQADEGGLKRRTAWHLLVQGWATDDKSAPLDNAYGLKASVEQRLARIAQKTSQGKPTYPGDYLLGGRIVEIKIGPGVCYPAVDAASEAFFFLPVSVDYEEDLTNPFV